LLQPQLQSKISVSSASINKTYNTTTHGLFQNDLTTTSTLVDKTSEDPDMELVIFLFIR
ncbi:unnamed protein product, partial [Adineta ricciae]